MNLKLNIAVTYSNGTTVDYPVALPEWTKWERKTGKSMYAMGEISDYQMADFLDLAYFAYKRQSAGAPTKPQETWELSVEGLEIKSDDPKSSSGEALADS